MRILVTGANGYIGRVTCRVLFGAGHTPIPMTREDVDLKNSSEFFNWLAAVEAPDAVVHLAGTTTTSDSWDDPAGVWADNVGGTANLIGAMDYAYGRTIPLVLASSSAVFGAATGYLDETVEVQPDTPYGGSKAAVEKLLDWEEFALDSIALRFFNVAGGWDGIADPDRTRVVSAALAVAVGEEQVVTLANYGRDERDFLHVWDAAEAIRIATEFLVAEKRCGNFNIGSGIATSMMQVVEAARRLTGHPIEIVWTQSDDEARTVVADSTSFRQLTGWVPRRSGIDQIVEDAWAAMRSGS